MLTMNYEDLQYKYGRKKKKKNKGKRLVDEKYKLTKCNFTASEWKDYNEWLKEQKEKEKLVQKMQKQSKKPKAKKKQKQPKNISEEKPKDAKQKYKELLKHPMWKKKRDDVLLKQGFKCQLCGATHAILQVHHTYYSKGRNPWEYPTSSLVVLCKACHDKVHKDESHPLNPKNYGKNIQQV